MFTFLVGALGGALATGGYVLLRTPRSGKENQEWLENYYNTAKYNAKNVQDKAGDVQEAVTRLQTELANVQVNVVPDIMESVEDLQTNASVYTRRINDTVDVINHEIEDMNQRINRQNENIKMGSDTSDDN